jgi:hypothetical protein
MCKISMFYALQSINIFPSNKRGFYHSDYKIIIIVDYDPIILTIFCCY